MRIGTIAALAILVTGCASERSIGNALIDAGVDGRGSLTMGSDTGPHDSGTLRDGALLLDDAATTCGADCETTLAGGRDYVCALRAGAVQCWGQLLGTTDDYLGFPYDVPTTAAIAEIASGASHSLLRTEDGRVFGWGSNFGGQLSGVEPTSGTLREILLSAPVHAVGAGSLHSCAAMGEGQVSCWGNNGNNEVGASCASSNCNRPHETTGIAGSVQSLSLGSTHSCALNDAGDVFCWGDPSYGALGAAAATPGSDVVQILGLSDAVEVRSGPHFVCARDRRGEIRCWGANDAEQLGRLSSSAVSRAPQVVASIPAARSVGVGSEHACIASVDGEVWCWGANQAGQSGVTASGSTEPVRVPGVEGAISVTAGAAYSCAALSDGTVMCWGGNDCGELGNGTGGDCDSAVSAREIAAPGQVQRLFE